MVINEGGRLRARAMVNLDAVRTSKQRSMLDPQSSDRLRAHAFAPSTVYTVTNFVPTKQHFLVRCDAPDLSGVLRMRLRSFAFACAP